MISLFPLRSLYLWNGDLIWDYNISNETYQHHHDIEPLPNGNILILVWEKKNAAEATEVGRQELNNSLNENAISDRRY
ncbi:MAG: aryl-sulfate sulfotransferase [bacterium]